MSDIDDLRIKFEFAVALERFLLRKSMQAQIDATTAGQKATDLARELKKAKENNGKP